jgi:hypothetical protein
MGFSVMLPEERDQLLALFGDARRWCQEAEARDQSGDPVRYSDAEAVAWDITGGVCRLFGWRRACELFPQLDRHIFGRRLGRPSQWDQPSDSMTAMAALQDYNDQHDTTYQEVFERLKTMPVWQGNRFATP